MRQSVFTEKKGNKDWIANDIVKYCFIIVWLSD